MLSSCTSCAWNTIASTMTKQPQHLSKNILWSDCTLFWSSKYSLATVTHRSWPLFKSSNEARSNQVRTPWMTKKTGGWIEKLYENEGGEWNALNSRNINRQETWQWWNAPVACNTIRIQLRIEATQVGLNRKSSTANAVGVHMWPNY